MQSSHVVGFPRNWWQWLPWRREMWQMEGGVNEGEIFFTVYSSVPFGFIYSKINFKIKKKNTQNSLQEGKFNQKICSKLPWWLISKECACKCKETQVQFLIREDPKCRGGTKSVHHNCWACTHLGTTAPEPTSPRARALQQETPLQWEACAPQLESSPCLLHLEKSSHSNEDPAQSKIKK